MNDANAEHEFDRELIDRLIDGVASEGEFARAEELLRRSPAARRHYVEKRYLVASLHNARGAKALSAPVAAGQRRQKPIRLAAAIVAAAALSVATFWVFRAGSPGGDSADVHRPLAARPVEATPPTEPAPVDDGLLATLVVGSAPRFEGRLQPIEGRFRKGRYSLAEGAISLRFDNGVELTLESPAEFELVHSKLVSLQRGKARARVPESGQGFVIAAPGVDIEDLGTEFGVLVEPDRTTALHVFNGAVELHRKGRPSVQLDEDSTTVLKNGRDLAWHDVGEIEFPTTSQVAHQQWRAFSEKLRTDPSVVVYYDFEQNPLRPDVLHDRGPGARPIDGTVRGGFWTSGRWPNKGALFFDRDGDCVEVDIPGEFDAFTLHAWIRINRLEFPRQTFFGARGWDRPGLHKLIFCNTGEFAAAVRGDSPEFRVHRTAVGTIPVGNWMHLVAVVDRKAGVAAYYKDGRQILSAPVAGDFPLVFGPTIIGGFIHQRSAAWPYRLQYRGWIDELALFDRPLSPREVGELYEQGRCFE